MRIHIYDCMNVYMNVHIFTFVCMNVCTYLRMCLRMNSCM